MQRVNETSAVVLPVSNERIDTSSGSIQFIGTATLLIRYAGFTILTDPNFLHMGEHVHIGYGLTAKRLTNPAIKMSQLPPFDFVLLSHMHEDHFDLKVQSELDKGTTIVTTPQAATALRRVGFPMMEQLNTWETLTFVKGDYKLRITAMPGTHGPGALANMLPQVMGSMLEFQNANDQTLVRIYISGDTLLFDALQEIPKRYPNIDMGIFHLGGTRIMGILLTMDARQGLDAVELINAKTSIPVHFNDYTVFKSPLEHFQELVKLSGLDERVHYLSHGDTYTFNVANP
jgi:L-ascorbate metabolism protein UlaG (beta-lactamase superfamily)